MVKNIPGAGMLKTKILCFFKWSLFCLVQVYKSLHFLPILLVKINFCFCVLVFHVSVYMWSSFCSVRVYKSLHFLPILLVKIGFRPSVFWFFLFLYIWFLAFTFSVLCFEFNIISNYLYNQGV